MSFQSESISSSVWYRLKRMCPICLQKWQFSHDACWIYYECDAFRKWEGLSLQDGCSSVILHLGCELRCQKMCKTDWKIGPSVDEISVEHVLSESLGSTWLSLFIQDKQNQPVGNSETYHSFAGGGPLQGRMYGLWTNAACSLGPNEVWFELLSKQKANHTHIYKRRKYPGAGGTANMTLDSQSIGPPMESLLEWWFFLLLIIEHSQAEDH